jgi:hypothetical protein
VPWSRRVLSSRSPSSASPVFDHDRSFGKYLRVSQKFCGRMLDSIDGIARWALKTRSVEAASASKNQQMTLRPASKHRYLLLLKL